MDFLDRSAKSTQTSNFLRTRRIRAALFHADGQTGMTKLTVAFHNFFKSLKIKIDGSASSGGQEKYDGWPWHFLEAALSILNVMFSSKEQLFCKKLKNERILP